MTVLAQRLAAALAVLSALFALPLAAQEAEARIEATAPVQPQWSFAIHGGAGTIARESMTAEQDAAYRAALQGALDAGAAVLARGGSAVDAVEAAIVLMEDDPLFNAGRGAVYSWDGANELDASIMDGATRDAGAVAGVVGVRHPIRLARRVMTDSPHVMLSGAGAATFASEQGLETMPPEWFGTERRREALERLKAEQLSAIDVDIKFGTVGAVALDSRGNLAAGTSTGGMTGKRWGRIGDAPIIGAGTYADNRSCAVSATGWGEYFIRVGVAHEICARLRISGTVLSEVPCPPMDDDAIYICEEMGSSIGQAHAQRTADSVMSDVRDLGGDGGIILVTPDGHALYSFNTAGMYRGRATSEGVNEVAIYGDE